MKFRISTFFAAALLLTFITSGYAETRYISDLLVVTVRSGKGNNYQILATLPTASPVVILEEDKTYVKARTEKGIEGYIRKQYVSKAIPKSMQIAKLSKQKAALEDQRARQQAELQDAKGLSTSSQTIIEQLTNDLKLSEQQRKSVNNDYTQLKKQSDNVINLTTERDRLLEENNQIISELQVLQEENKSFHRSNMIQWFLAGGGVFLVGWLIGKVSRKKRGFSRI